MKTHLNLATSDLDRAVSFYSVLLNAKPAKALTDYALFVTEQPGLELALDRRDAVLPADDAHHGIYVETPDEVDRAIARLSAAGLATSVEREETCCYANQTKAWAVDPEPHCICGRGVHRRCVLVHCVHVLCKSSRYDRPVLERYLYRNRAG